MSNFWGAVHKGASPKRYNLDEWDEKEHPVHRVGISSFYMNRYEVTNELWNAIMDTNPSVFKDAKLPVQNVSWSAVQEFILKSATKLFSVLLASKRPLITELADKLRLKYPLLPTISPCPTMRLEAIRSIIPISCRRYPKSV